MLRGSGKYNNTPRKGDRAARAQPIYTRTPAARSHDPSALVGGRRGLLLQADDSKTATPHARIRAAGAFHEPALPDHCMTCLAGWRSACGATRTFRNVRYPGAMGWEADLEEAVRNNLNL
jgi:hypothetical protein